MEVDNYYSMGKLIDGRKIAEKINKKTAEKVKELRARGIIPKLGVVLVGDDKSSVLYVNRKKAIAEKIGVDFVLHKLPANISKTELLNKIKEVQKKGDLSGLIIQLPLPDWSWTFEAVNRVSPDIDVDCLTNENLGKIVSGSNFISPPTAGAVVSILEDLKINLAGKNIVLVGTGLLVGKPLAAMLINKRASVTTCNRATKNIKEKCREADIIVSSAGKRNLIRGNMIKKNAIVIDAGVSFLRGKAVGDVSVKEVLPIAKYITPTPGGVGPITVAMLLKNTVKCAGKI